LSRTEQNRIELMGLTQAIYTSHPSFGYRDIASIIRSTTGWMVSDLSVHRACRYLGYRSQARHYAWVKRGEEHVIYKNLVSGTWNAQRPLAIIAADMTILRYRGIAYEWTFMVDTFNNSIIASASSPYPGDPRPYYRCLEQLLVLIDQLHVNDPVILHSDQGSVFASRGFSEAHKNYNILRSMSRQGTPTDNPIIESLNGWIKAEIRCDYRISDYDSLEDFLKHYIHFFNHERPSFKLKYKTPAQFTAELGFTPFLFVSTNP
jgi:putative transposase